MTHEAGLVAYNNIKLNVVAKDKLLVMAYEHAIRFLKLSKLEQEKKNFYESFQLVLKSKKIIRELQNSLNMDIAEISVPLFRLYDYMNYKLNQVNVGLNVLQPIDEVIELLEGIKSAWEEALKKEAETKKSFCQPSPSLNSTSVHRVFSA